MISKTAWEIRDSILDIAKKCLAEFVFAVVKLKLL